MNVCLLGKTFLTIVTKARILETTILVHVVNQMYFPLSARRPASLELYATQAAGADFPAKYQLPNKSKVNTEI